MHRLSSGAVLIKSAAPMGAASLAKTSCPPSTFHQSKSCHQQMLAITTENAVMSKMYQDHIENQKMEMEILKCNWETKRCLMERALVEIRLIKLFQMGS